MYIFERIIGLSCFVGCLFVTLYLLSRVRKKYCGSVLFGYLVLLTLFAYFFKPNVLDLSRLQNMCLRTWCYYPWSTLQNFLKTSAVPMWYLFSWGIFNLTHDLNYIQAVTCFWCFGNVLYVINDLIIRWNLRGIKRALLLFAIMAIGSFYMQTISDIRNMLSFSICFWCMYREIIQGKSIIWHIPLYIVAILFHQAGAVLVGGRMLAFAPLQKGVLRKVAFAGIVFALAWYVLKYQGFFFNSAQEKAYAYSSNAQEFRSWKETIIGLIELVQIFYVLACYKINTNLKYREMWIFSLILSLICFVSVPISYAIFRRFTIVCSLLILPLVAHLLSDANLKNRKNFMWVFLGFSCIIFLLSYMIGDMRFYQFLM